MRSHDWIKVPARRRAEFVVVGFIAATEGRLEGRVVADRDLDGCLSYAGVVGPGLSDDDRCDLLASLRKIERHHCPLATAPDRRNALGRRRGDTLPHWVEPRLVAEVEYGGRTTAGLRHATLKDVRPDRPRAAIAGRPRTMAFAEPHNGPCDRRAVSLPHNRLAGDTARPTARTVHTW